MAAFLAIGVAALANLLALLGMGFIASRGFGLLWSRSAPQRTLIFAGAFAAMVIVTMMMSFPLAPGIVGDLRNVVIAVAAVVGGAIPALTTAAVAAAFRLQLGGQVGAALVGIALAAALSIAFARGGAMQSPRRLALFGIVLAFANAALPFAALGFSTITPAKALYVGATVLAFAGVTYPFAIVVVGCLLNGELRRAEDVSGLRTLNAALSFDAALVKEMFERTGVAMVWSNLSAGRFLQANPQFANFTGYSEDELAGMPFETLSVPEDREKDSGTIAPFVSGAATSVTEERRYLRKDGKIVWGVRSLTAVRGPEGSSYGFALVQDITERKKAREQITYLASHDAMTGLSNRLVLLDRLADAIARRVAGELVAVLYLDLDDFKEVNDTFGHPAGDTTLVEVARRLRDCVAEEDVVARFGGDEFAVLRKAATSVEEVRALAETIIGRVRQPFARGGDVATIGVSIGIACGPRDGLDAEELLKRADIALYAAKAAGSGTYRFFDAAMEARVVARQALKVDLTAALSNNELDIEYQPVVDLRRGGVASFEALLRWRHPRRGAISPADFIPLAEETGLIVPIGDWVIKRACAEAMTWPAHVGVAINVSAVQFRDQALAARVAANLAETGLSPHRLELEITETVLMHDSEDNLRRLRELRGLGLKIALDDFGTGYSSLSYLQRFPFDRIKIDRSFVKEVAERPEAKAVVRAIIGLGHSLHMRITAEGIESREQLERIAKKGCDEAQGFFFSRPVGPRQIPALIAQLSSSPSAYRESIGRYG